jgi:hypothetical protein
MAAVIVLMIVHFLVWCAVAVPTFMISPMFRQRRAT